MDIKVVGYHGNIANPGGCGTPRIYLTGTDKYEDIFQNFEYDSELAVLKPEIVELIFNWMLENKYNKEYTGHLLNHYDPWSDDDLRCSMRQYYEISDSTGRIKMLKNFDQHFRDWIECEEILEAIELVDENFVQP